MFVSGDRVRCIRNNPVWLECYDFSLPLNEEFIVEESTNDELKLQGKDLFYCADRFEKITQ